MNVLPPDLAADYEIFEILNKGGMGVVYKARHRRSGEPCVIKVMHEKLGNDERARKRFFSEGKKGKQLDHRNIARVRHLFVSPDGQPAIVMEYVEGRNLYELLAQDGPVDAKLAVTIGVQALAALRCLHRKKIVHRDISPQNLMLTKDSGGEPLVKLIDLGLAKSLEENSYVTTTGYFLGKVKYASPEQFEQRADARSDFYSLGVVLYQLLTGTLPIDAPNAVAMMLAHRQTGARSFSEADRKNRVPEGLRRVVRRALKKRPEERFQSASEFSAALQRSLPGDTKTELLPAAPPKHPAPVPHAAVAAMAATVVVAAALGAWTLRERGAPHPPVPPRVTASRSVVMTGAQKQELEAMLRAAIRDGRNPSPNDPLVAAFIERNDLASAPVWQFAAGLVGRVNGSLDSVSRGERLTKAGDLRQAFDAFDEATKRDPANANAWAQLGGAAARLDRQALARDACERALAVDPANWLAHYNLACQFARAGQPDDGWPHLRAAVRELRRQARSPADAESVIQSMRAEAALGALRTDSRFTALVAADY